MEFAVLGPLEVTDKGVRLDLGGLRQRRLLAQLAGFRETNFGDMSPNAADRRLDECLKEAKIALSADRYDKMWRRGAAMSLDEAIEFAQSAVGREDPASLTPT
jgi:hypothetical protein